MTTTQPKQSTRLFPRHRRRKTTASPPVPRNRWRRHIVVLVLLLAVGGVVGTGSIHHPLPPAHGTGIFGTIPATEEPATLRVATFNIHSGRDADGNFNLDRTADCLQGMDLIGLNEVRGPYPWQDACQTQLLGEKLELAWLFAPTEHRWWCDNFGNGLLSRLPVGAWHRQPMPGTRHKGHRNYVLAEIQFRGQTVQVMVTHLDRVHDRAAQLAEVAERFLELPEPAILMGDLNTTADDARLAELLGTPGVHDCLLEGQSGSPPVPRRIDWILARGLQTRSAGMIERGASDHPCIWAELDLPATP